MPPGTIFVDAITGEPLAAIGTQDKEAVEREHARLLGLLAARGFEERGNAY